MTLWDEKMLIGIPVIDDQHRNLVNALNELIVACSNNHGQDSIKKTLLFVVDYIKVHFADEEKIQIEYDYPYLNDHRKLHNDFISTIATVIKDYERDHLANELIANTNMILINWITEHIYTEDKKIGDYVHTKNKGLE